MEAVNVFSAVVFQAGELLLLGVVQTADDAAQELARSGDPGAAVAAGAATANAIVSEASGLVADAVETAATNIRDSFDDPFPSATTSRVADPPVAESVRAVATQGGRRNPTLLPVATMTRISPPKAGAPTVSRLERWSGI